jgi:MFS family permease
MTLSQQKSKVRFTLAVLFAINLLNFYDRSIFGAVAEPIRKQWGLTDAQVGWLATAFTLLYAVVGVPMGRLSDTQKRSRLLAAGVAVWSLLTAASGWAWNFAAMFVTRLGVGVGEAVCAPAGNSLIGDLYPAQKRGRALGIFMLGLPIGYFLGSWISGQVAASYGWRIAFYVACLPGLLIAFLALRVLDPPRGAAEAHAAPQPEHSGSPYWAVLRIPTLCWIIASGVVYNFDGYAYATFLPAYLIRYHGQGLRGASLGFAIFWGVGGVVGLLSGGWIADRVSHQSRSGRLVVGAVALLLCAVGAYLALELPPGQVKDFVILMGGAATLFFLYYPCVYATIQDVVPPSLRGTAMAMYFFAMYLLGGSFGPVIVGRISDHFARQASTGSASGITEAARAAGLHSAMYVLIVGCILVSVALLGAATTVARDMGVSQLWSATTPDVPVRAEGQD